MNLSYKSNSIKIPVLNDQIISKIKNKTYSI